MLLLIDNYDSFTYNLVDYFNQLGEECHVVKNDAHPSLLQNVDEFSGLVLSPGPGRPEAAGYLMEYIRRFEGKIPILGICLGHQAIALYFGAKVKKAIKPMHGKISCIEVKTREDIFKGIPDHFKVVRYHSLIADLNSTSQLIGLGSTAEQENMVLKHINKPIYGLQYHPEAVLTEHGLKLLDNWLLVSKQKGPNELVMLIQ